MAEYDKNEKEQHSICGAYEENLRQRDSFESLEKLDNFSSEYDIEMHGLKNEGHEFIQSQSIKEHHSESGDESISDEENAALSNLSFTTGAAGVKRSYYYDSESENQQETCTWSAVIEEANKLAFVHKKTSSSSFISDISEAREIHRGGRGRAKLKFSIRSLSHKEDLSWSGALKDGNDKSYEDATESPGGHNNLEHRTMEKSMAELLGNIQEECDELPTEVAFHEQRGAVPSVAELLEDLQQKNCPSGGPSNLLLQDVKAKQRKAQFAGKRTMSHLGTRILDNEDPPEFTSGGLSSEDEDIDRNHLRFATQKDKEHTMADLFQEAFCTSETERPLFPTSKQSGIGYHGRLQQILQIEKDRHLEFLKHSQTGQSLSNESCIEVKILSRFLDAKLTVCQCLFGRKTNSSQSMKGIQTCAGGGTTKRTIIFSSKICDSVELEVGNLVRIHPPWYGSSNNDSVCKASSNQHLTQPNPIGTYTHRRRHYIVEQL